ncbi:MAG TPA: ice-binding family protein, partial [Acidimicrobiia bacterium]|nr:ice-binding family protein [Acidimicrobiia bacterium]
MTIHLPVSRWRGTALVACTMVAAVPLMIGNAANAGIVPTVPLGTSAAYAVLGASTVTNTGTSTLDGSLGLWPGTSITGFPPGRVLPPGTINATNAAAQRAESDLTAAYGNAAGRSVDGTTTADLANLKLQAGVYAGPSRSPLGLTGPLVLDGAGNLSSVFIFQTDSTLTTASSSTVTLINGAQECNVFWQVGSSATLGTSSVFRGNILALASITATNGVVIHGRALARNGAVTLDNDTFVKPTCAQPPVLTGTSVTTTAPGNSAASGETGPGAGTPAAAGTPVTVTTSGGGGIPTPGGGADTPNGTGPESPTGFRPSGPDVPGVVGPPRTGGAPIPQADFPWVAVLGTLFVGLGTARAVLR